jgi:hypothetical protein
MVGSPFIFWALEWVNQRNGVVVAHPASDQECVSSLGQRLRNGRRGGILLDLSGSKKAQSSTIGFNCMIVKADWQCVQITHWPSVGCVRKVIIASHSGHKASIII